MNDAKESNHNLCLPMKPSANCTFLRIAFGIYLSSIYKTCSNTLLFVSRWRAGLVCRDLIILGWLLPHSVLLFTYIKPSFWPRVIGLALILHTVNLRTRRDTQCTLGARCSLCCLLKMQGYRNRKGNWIFLFLSWRIYKKHGVKMGKNMVCPGNPEL